MAPACFPAGPPRRGEADRGTNCPGFRRLTWGTAGGPAAVAPHQRLAILKHARKHDLHSDDFIEAIASGTGFREAPPAVRRQSGPVAGAAV